MVNAIKGVLLTCDTAMKAFIKHIDAERQAQAQQNSFILKDMDDTHLLVREDAMGFVNERLRELQMRHSYSRYEQPVAVNASGADE
jgi:TFIIH basal transcription factor complex TTD-A subunit